jgi:hypothetical protein
MISTEQEKCLEAGPRLYLERLRLERLNEAKSLAKESQLNLQFRRRLMGVRGERIDASAHNHHLFAHNVAQVETK